jgi:hypothetical protein
MTDCGLFQVLHPSERGWPDASLGPTTAASCRTNSGFWGRKAPKKRQRALLISSCNLARLVQAILFRASPQFVLGSAGHPGMAMTSVVANARRPALVRPCSRHHSSSPRVAYDAPDWQRNALTVAPQARGYMPARQKPVSSTYLTGIAIRRLHRVGKACTNFSYAILCKVHAKRPFGPFDGCQGAPSR